MIKLLAGETVVLELRRHWLPITLESLVILVAGFLPLALFFVQNLLSPNLFLFFAVAWLQIFWLAFFVVWTNYYLDILVITNKRVIDIEQITLFNRDVAQLKLENIQDVRVQVEGFWSSILNFGDLYVQTAGESREFVIKSIPKPLVVQELILKQGVWYNRRQWT